jgi:hypothetical protein
MIDTIKTVTRRAQATLLQDLIGGTALFVMLVVALHMPRVF